MNSNGLGSILGIAAAILFTPRVFAATRYELYHYFLVNVGQDFAMPLTYVMGGVEFILIFQAVQFLITVAVIWFITGMGGGQR